MCTLVISVAYSAKATLNKTYTVDHGDSTSQVYQQEAAAFCAAVDSTFESSNIAQDYTGCVVTGFE